NCRPGCRRRSPLRVALRRRRGRGREPARCVRVRRSCMLCHRVLQRTYVVGSVAILALATAAHANINLCLVATTTARVGDTVDVNLVVTSDNALTQSLTGA